MEDFTPIETQEAFDNAVKDKLEEVRKSFKGFISPEKAAEKENALQTEIAQLKTANLRLRIAQETGLPSDLAERLSGTTEEEIRADAETLSKYSAPVETPTFTPETPPEDNRKSAFREMLRNLNA